MQSKKYEKTAESKTTSVARALSELVKRENVHPASVDFDILAVKTFIKEPNKEDYAPFTKEHLAKLQNEDFILDSKMTLLQEYVVRFKPTEPLPFRLNVSLATDEFHSVATATIKAGSVIKLTKDIKQQLFNYFNKIKLKNKMLIYLFDNELRLSINKLVEKANSEPFEEDLTITLARWSTPVATIDDKIEFIYQQKDEEVDENQKVDYAERGFISAVKSGDLLIRYTLPKKGKAGRNFTGKYIPVEEPEVNNYPSFGIADTIDVQTDGNYKLYYAKDDGYVKLENNILSIDKTMSIADINLKTTGNIKAGIDKDVKIQVDGKDPSEEVIGSDMVVEASEVNANGSVASGAVIKAEKITITGQTHQTSQLFAKEIDVNILRGVARGEDVKVRSLEGGTIKAQKATITQAVGGVVRACYANIENLRGKSTVEIAKTLTIQNVLRGENKISVDPMINPETKEQIDTAFVTVDEYKKEIENIAKEIEKNDTYLRKNQEAFKQVQLKITEDKKEGRTPSEIYMKMARDFVTALKKQDSLRALSEDFEEKITAKKHEIEQFDEEVLKAEIINETASWVGYNEVRFKLPVLQKEYLRTISEGERILKLKLILNKDGDYEVMTVHG